MNTEQLNTLESLEGKQLVIRISGSVDQSNLAEFEENAMQVISSIKTDLQTDDDFAEAEANIKACQLIETRIHNARQDAINSTREIATLIATTERLEAKFRETRLLLNSKVKSEKEARKNEIINGAKNRLSGLLIKSPVKHGFTIDLKAIMDASKNRRSLAKLKEAVDEVAEAEELRLANMEEDFAAAMELIRLAEVEYPGLFADKNNLALQQPAIVESQIQSRIATFRFEVSEKERRAKEAEEKRIADEKAESDRIAARMATAIAEARKEEVPQDSVWQPPALNQTEPLLKPAWVAPAPTFPPPTFSNPFAHQGSVFLRVEVEAGKEQQVMDAIGKFPSVLNVSRI